MSEITFGNAQVGGVNLHYAKAGAGEKLVVLLHGFPEFWYSWREQIKALGDTYTVIAPDMRGFGLSDKPEQVSDYEAAKVTDDIIGLIRFLGYEQAAVIGHDWGATIAWVIATNHPEVLWKLGALQVPPIATWRKNQSLEQLFASWYMFFFQIPSLPEYLMRMNDYAMLEKSLRGSTAKPDVFSDEDIAEYKKAWGEPGALTGMLNYYRANIVKRFLDKVEEPKKIKVPTLFIYGEKDKAVLPRTVAGVADMIDAPFTEVRIPGSGHWVQQEAGDEVTRALREFLAG